eukprot:scaffold155124_cov36-Cyclotella_meneghiniana.AAC.1
MQYVWPNLKDVLTYTPPPGRYHQSLRRLQQSPNQSSHVKLLKTDGLDLEPVEGNGLLSREPGADGKAMVEAKTGRSMAGYLIIFQKLETALTKGH